MTDLSVLNEYAGALALLALIFSCATAALLIALLIRTGREKHTLDDLARQQKDSREDIRRTSESMLACLSQREAEQEQRMTSRLDTMRGENYQQSETLRASLHGQMEQLRQSQENGLRGNEERMDGLCRTVADSLSAIRTDNEKQLGEMRQTVDEKLHAELDRRLGESFRAVNERLEAVFSELGKMNTLAGGVDDLKKVLSNVKTRGIWGEMQLGMLLSQMLSPEQYRVNTETVPNSRERVEYAVVLPGRGDGQVLLPIDSKFPVEDYARIQEAYEAADAGKLEECRTALARRIREEAKRIGKYIALPYTTDFAVMFLPTEGLYAEVLNIPGLAEEIQEKNHITVSGPTTLCALLTALQTGFRTLAIEKRSGEVWKLLGSFKKEFICFTDTLQRSKKKLDEVSESIDRATRQTQTIGKKLNAVEDPAYPLPSGADPAETEENE